MRRRSLLLASCALMAASLPARAHGPTPHKAEERITIKAEPARVWAIVGNFQDVSWHPLIAAAHGEGGSAVGASRTITLKEGKSFKGGGDLVESLDDYDAAGMSYAWRLEEEDVQIFPVSFYSAVLSVKPAADGGSEVVWEGRFYRGETGNEPPPELDDAAAEAAMGELLQAGLEGIRRRAEAEG